MMTVLTGSYSTTRDQQREKKQVHRAKSRQNLRTVIPLIGLPNVQRLRRASVSCLRCEETCRHEILQLQLEKSDFWPLQRVDHN